DAYFASPLAQGTPGKQCGLAATGDYQPSLRSPWLAAQVIRQDNNGVYLEGMLLPDMAKTLTQSVDDFRAGQQRLAMVGYDSKEITTTVLVASAVVAHELRGLCPIRCA
ncbi:MAG: hypothetical protein JMN24_18040, partial [gamma proteobacterium endosymbiont of Lamellibrachia anaximandri]|nr:hypothetical protein [gamma proteobacterium endosymbiont of Lamellibrachia anaximandri]